MEATMKRLRSIFVEGNLILILLSACSAGYSNAEIGADKYGNRNGEPSAAFSSNARADGGGQQGDGPQEPSRPADQQSAAFLPVVPVIADYEYTPKYFLQWINDSPLYSMIEAVVAESKPPVYEITLTEKATSRRIIYSNSENVVKALTEQGQAAHHTPIEYKLKETVGEQPTHEFSFRDGQGKVIRWKFIPASDLSERGSGMSPGRRRGLSFAYRKLGTAAGEGTAVQIGDAVSNAAPWPQISSPPYFVAYRGAHSIESEFGGLGLGGESWRVKTAPSAMSEGAQWTLVNEQNVERHLRVAARSGDEVTISEVGASLPGVSRLTLVARETAQGFALKSIMIKNEERFMRVSFNPELRLSMAQPVSPVAEVAFQIEMKGGGKVSEGIITSERSGNAITMRWQPRSPDWAKSRSFSSTISLDPQGYKIEVR
jgi:hypothetical protein